MPIEKQSAPHVNLGNLEEGKKLNLVKFMSQAYVSTDRH
jgi:hypothetical protein